MRPNLRVYNVDITVCKEKILHDTAGKLWLASDYIRNVLQEKAGFQARKDFNNACTLGRFNRKYIAYVDYLDFAEPMRRSFGFTLTLHSCETVEEEQCKVDVVAR